MTKLLSLSEIATLPSLPLTQRALLPRVTCVYFVFTEQQGPAYIGKAIDLRARWTNHMCLAHMQDEDRVYWLEIAEVCALEATERQYIIAYQPPLNKTFGRSRWRKFLNTQR